jgi:hypothetical protein
MLSFILQTIIFNKNFRVELEEKTVETEKEEEKKISVDDEDR